MNYGYDLTGPLSKQGAEEFVSVLKQALTAYSERSNAPRLLLGSRNGLACCR